MNHALPAAATLLWLSSLSAQVVTTGIEAATTLTATTLVGSQLSQSTVPAGPLVFGGNVGQTGNDASASASWHGGASPLSALAQIRHLVTVITALPPSAAACATEHVVEFDASTPCPAILEFERTAWTSPGVVWPTVQIDIGADGGIDIANLLVGSTTLQLPDFGTQPLRVRVVMSSAVVGVGFADTIVDVRVRPDNNVATWQIASGCGTAAHALKVLPIFTDRGVRLYVPPLSTGSTPMPSVLVVGTSAQPQLLPPFQGLPCLVVPSPDLLLLSTAQGQAVPVPLPLAVRPLQFHVQAVVLAPWGLTTTDAFLVSAF
jgi:hypothetical protein